MNKKCTKNAHFWAFFRKKKVVNSVVLLQKTFYKRYNCIISVLQNSQFFVFGILPGIVNVRRKVFRMRVCIHRDGSVRVAKPKGNGVDGDTVDANFHRAERVAQAMQNEFFLVTAKNGKKPICHIGFEVEKMFLPLCADF